ncbi:MAG: hypothetical protein C0453_11960 [Comamonadaceae bacterium]|nr:hypothetical protein [Comamonadaceae bacterium]
MPVTKKSIAAATLTWSLLAFGVTVQATEVASVGRVEMRLPGEGWQTYGVTDHGIAMSGGSVTRQQQTDTTVLVRRAPDETIDAVFIVRANATGKGRFSGVVFPDARCEGPAGTFVEGDPPSPAARSFRCLFVSQPGAVSLPDDFLQQLPGALGDQGWKLAPIMHLMAAKQYANTGAFLDVTVLMAPEVLPALTDATGQAAEPLPAGVTPASVHWGRLLQKAVTDSVYSIRGKFPVPDFLPSGAPSRSN